MLDSLPPGKRVPMSSTAEALPRFLLTVLIKIPIIIGVLLPLLLIYTIVTKLMSFCASKPGAAEKEALLTNISQVDEEVAVKPHADREFDLVLFGATGFTGSLAAKYLAARYSNTSGSPLRWAIAGRRRDALERLRAELQLPELSIIIADSGDDEALATLARRTKVCITTAGPFALYGTKLVRACAMAGTHYADITGETDWVRQMIDRFDETAKRTGATIVSFAGHDCIPWSVSVEACAEHLRSVGDNIVRVSCFDQLTGSFSGGTMATIFNSLTGRQVYKAALGFDPLLKDAAGQKSASKFSTINQGMIGYNAEGKTWVGPFVMAAVMANCVRRDNAVRHFTDALSYYEAQVYPNFMAAFVSFVDFIVLGLCVSMVPLRTLLLALGLLPSPGEGPSKEEQEAGFLQITTIATGAAGKKCKSTIYFPVDPGYRDTARMLVETGLALTTAAAPTVATGVHTPVSCGLGKTILQRLTTTGTTFSVESL